MLKFSNCISWDGNYDGVYYIPAYPKVADETTLWTSNNVHSCREFFIRACRSEITKSEYDKNLPCRKAQVLFTSGKCYATQYDTKMNKLKRASLKSLLIINSFEKEHKWPLTKMYEAKNTSSEPLPAIFWQGPRKWTMSPYLMSIWTLLVRIGRNDWMPKKLMDLKTNENIIRQLAIAAKSTHNGDANQMVRTIHEWNPFMALYKDLFTGTPRRDHWSKRHLNGGADRPEGILKLMTGTTHYKELNKRYFKLKKEKGL